MSDEKQPFDMYADFKNPDGTYNGVAFMAMMSGVSEAEIRDTWRAEMLKLIKEHEDA